MVLSLFKQQSPQHDELSMECFNWLKVRTRASTIACDLQPAVADELTIPYAGVARVLDKQRSSTSVRDLHGRAAAY